MPLSDKNATKPHSCSFHDEGLRSAVEIPSVGKLMPTGTRDFNRRNETQRENRATSRGEHVVLKKTPKIPSAGSIIYREHFIIW